MFQQGCFASSFLNAHNHLNTSHLLQNYIICTAGPKVNFSTAELVVRENKIADVLVPIVINQAGPDLTVNIPAVKLRLLESGEDDATFGVDFDLPANESCSGENSEPVPSCVTFAVNQTTAVLHVIIKHDQILEANESFHLLLSSSYRCTPYSMKIIILESAPRKLFFLYSYLDLLASLSLSHTPHTQLQLLHLLVQ